MAGLFSSSHSLLLAFLSICGVKTICAPTAREILVHIRLTQEIKAYGLQEAKLNKPKPQIPRKSGFTQTQAYLAVNQQLVQQIWGSDLIKYKSLIDQAIAREIDFKDDYYVFYHAQQSYYRILHDLMKEMYQLFAMEPGFKDFNFLRAWYDGPEKADVHEFLNMHESFLSTSWHYFDSQQMLCANFSLFGNTNAAYECTFFYFVNNANIMPPSLYICLQDFFNIFNFDTKFIDKLAQLADTVATQEGLLYQMFIPKNKVDQYAYLSYVGTAPWNKLINKDYFDAAKNRHIALSPILEQYCNDPFSIPEIDRIQARILLSKDLILNPESGIKVFRYTTANPQNEENYDKELKNILNEMVTQWLDDNKIRMQLAQHTILRSMPLGQFLKDFKG